MVRGLIIRRVFVLLDFALAVLIVGTAGMIAVSLVDIPVEEDASSVAELPQNSRGGGLVIDVGDRAAYDVILANGLFGEAGRWDPGAEPVEPEKPLPGPDIEETELHLKLVGTIALSDRDPFGCAFIENLDERGSLATFRLDDEVVEKVTLIEVYKREVVLLNERDSPPKKERLSMEDEEGGESKRAANSPTPAMRARRRSAETVTLSKQEFTQDIWNNYADLVKIKPTLYRDAKGKVAGVTADKIGNVPVAKKLGLSNGDVLQTVNGEKIDSQQKIMEMVQKYRNSSSFSIGILRNGRTKVITYRLN